MEDLEIQPQDTPEPEPAQETGQDQPQAIFIQEPQTISIQEWKAISEPGVEEAPQPEALEDAQLLAVLEACVYVAEEPLMPAQIAAALNQDPERIRALLQQLMAEFDRPEHGVSIKEVAGGYKMATKPEHHEAVRNFVKSLKTPFKLSLPALETLAVIAYKQPVTTPEIMEIRGVQGGGVLKTLLDRKLITEAGRKNVIGKPILYKTTREFLIQFGLKDLSELPSLKEFEEIGRMAMAESEVPADAPAAAADAPAVEVETADAPAQAAAPEAEAAVQADAPVVEVETSEAETPDAQPRAAAPETVAPADAAAMDAPAVEVETPEVETADAQPRAAAPEAEAAAPAAADAPAVKVDTPEAGTADAPPQAPAPETESPAPESHSPETLAAEEPAPPESQDR